jgi:4-hydroxyphenylpyruvate dioxygenase-like putative hemolysin
MVNSLDHIAFRIHRDNHVKACDMLVNLFGYEVVDKFEPEFGDGSTQGTECTVLSPKGVKNDTPRIIEHNGVRYQTMPDLFISSSSDPESIVAKYVAERGNIGGVHHCAYSTDNVETTMNEFKKAGVEFLTDEPIVCEELSQTFTKPSNLLNVIFEFIERRQASFCKSSVGKLMETTKNCK